MIMYGASGHGKVILDILELNKEESIEVWDDQAEGIFCEYPVKRPTISGISESNKIIISIGVNKTRKKVVDKLNNSFTFGKAIHPSAVIASRVKINAGSVVMGGSVINPGVSIGSHCIINTSASIDHDCELGDYVHISPNATLSGNVQVGEGTHIGSGAVAIQGVKIGKWCTIGAGTVIIRDIPDFATAVGNPVRIIKVKASFDEV